MNLVAVVAADFEHAFSGGPSQLDAIIGSRSVLAHTLARLVRVRGVERRVLLVRDRDAQRARAAVRAGGFEQVVEVLAIDSGARPRRELIRSARKWALDAWRGSPLGTTWFDEYVEPLEFARAADHCGADALLCLDGHQPALDPAIADAMIAHLNENSADAGFVFTQAPPGLAGIILRRETLRTLLEEDAPAGLLLAYRPETPRADPIARVECRRIEPLVAQTPARWTADVRGWRERLARAFAELGEDCDALALAGWLGGGVRRPSSPLEAPPAGAAARPDPLPLEVEIELTTDDPLPESRLRPRGSRVPRRRLDDLRAIERVAARLAGPEDRGIVFGGHGDPLLHPAFADACAAARSGGVCGLAVVTPLVELSDAALEALHAQRVDVLEVQLDANRAATYAEVHGADRFARVLSNVARVQESRAARRCPQPIVACSLTRCAATLDEVDAFFDRWTRATGWAVVRGYNRYCGLLAPDSLLSLEPPIRGPCRRLERRMTLLADGSVPYCAQDVAGATSVGSWLTEPIDVLWRGPALAALRAAHARGRWSEAAPCDRCGEWFRP